MDKKPPTTNLGPSTPLGPSTARLVGMAAALALVASTRCSAPEAVSPGRLASARKIPHRTEDPRLAEAISLHLRGVEGDDVCAERALGELESLRERYPSSPRVLAYVGSARMLAARRAFAPWEKARLCNEGLALLDEAVALAPEDTEVRFLRAVSTYPIPAFFERRTQCAADFAWLAERHRESVDAGAITSAMADLVLRRHEELGGGTGREEEEE